jgi:hypothetical protein
MGHYENGNWQNFFSKADTQVFVIEGKPSCDQKATADAFCNYLFL